MTQSRSHVLRWFEHQKVYAPLREMLLQPRDLNVPCEEVRFRAADQTALYGWFFPSRSEQSSSPVTLLFLHGNAGNVSTRPDWYEALLETGAHVFCIDYRGYGLSEGVPSETGTYLDAQAAVQWLCDQGHRRIVALGESLGGGVASELALRERLSGLILVNTFSSVTQLGQEMFPWLPVRFLNSIHYHTLAKLPRLDGVPLLILHSRDDQLIGLHHARANFEAAREPKWFREIRGGHNEPLVASRNEIIGAIRAFLAEPCVGQTPPGVPPA